MNSNWINNNNGKSKALIIVPHEDDEILVAGNLICHLTLNNVCVYVAFTTNGDWKTKARIRIREALQSLEILGVNKENVIFLGYGDCLNSNKKDHIYYHSSGFQVSPAGHIETYADFGKNDFSFMKNGKHNAYNSTNFQNDLYELILAYLPELLVCCDFDEHSDHRILSLYFDKVLNKILKDYEDYRPKVLKRFAYSLAYFAERDWFYNNLQSTKRPLVGVTYKYDFDMVDSFNYIWNDRIRIPAVDMRCNIINKRNRIFKALSCHRSQHIIYKAEGIINSDEVFWEKQVNNLALMAEVDVSSGEKVYISDGLYYDVDNIDDKIPYFKNYRWVPCKEDTKRTILFRWNKSVDISEIRIYGGYSERKTFCIVNILLSNSYSFSDKAEFYRGRAFLMKIPLQTSIKYCLVSFEDIDEEQFGISEIEFPTIEVSHTIIRPFIKLEINDSFLPVYYIDNKTKNCKLAYFAYGEAQHVTISVKQGNAEIIDDQINISDKCQKAVVEISATIQGQIVCDSIMIKRLNIISRLLFRASLLPEKAKIFCTGIDFRYEKYKEYFKNHNVPESFKWVFCKFFRHLKIS